ncbi:hypothetical protein PGTUg99_010926 [Puccinia graminis f. sp. tritici]|uniref:Uncharacterized protein n=1 Tax=Puccinia graminis f. sp. tritici TaxID=56615 RepID=A0A5B0M4Z2_PUCGR|nr:hypothetical protein PGTUg99_010926 [Puccinia graminis f. sp. tritici]
MSVSRSVSDHNTTSSAESFLLQSTNPRKRTRGYYQAEAARKREGLSNADGRALPYQQGREEASCTGTGMADHPTSIITTVIFDVGGVVVKSPLLGVNKFEKAEGLPADYLNVAITARGADGAFQKLEVGALQLPEFYAQVSYALIHRDRKLRPKFALGVDISLTKPYPSISGSFGQQFGDQMSDTPFNNPAYKRFCMKTKRTCPSLPTTLQVDGKQLWKQMMVEALTPNLPIIKLIKRLRESGKYRVAALTNNFQLPAGKTEDDQEALGLAPMEIKNLFHEFIESSQVGLRKPDPKFFEYALKLLNVRSPKEVVFFDDIG